MFIRRFDVLLLITLVIARARIDTLADLAAPRPIETIRKVGWLAGLLSDSAWKLMEDWLTDPISLLLISVTFGLALVYVIVDLMPHVPSPTSNFQLPTSNFPLKLFLIFAIILTTVVAQSVYLIALRHVAGPANYTHDGGVIQTEEAIKFLLQGRNPYTEDYTQTPMAQWGLDYKTALYHYPYLPWTFLFSLPFYLVSNATLGWYDQRFVYLILFVVTLLLAPRITAHPMAKLSLVMLLGLNPIMGSDIIFGQNDSFVLFWIVAALCCEVSNWRLVIRNWEIRTWWLSSIAFGFACASKPTAWFLAPFFLLHVLRNAPTSSSINNQSPITNYRRLLPFIITFLLIVLPFALWDPTNFYDDVWAWSAGTSPTAYQIRGWGLANFVLALNLVPSRLAYFPFWIPEVIVCAPLLILLMRRQWRENMPANIAWHGGILLFAFAFTSRFLNENYLGFIVSVLALGTWLTASEPQIVSVDRAD